MSMIKPKKNFSIGFKCSRNIEGFALIYERAKCIELKFEKIFIGEKIGEKISQFLCQWSNQKKTFQLALNAVGTLRALPWYTSELYALSSNLIFS